MNSNKVNIESTLTELRKAAATASNEEEFKISAERTLYNEVISKLGLQPGRYEYTFISGGRLDALYGHVLIEYKAPGKLSRPSDVARAKEQLIGYIGKEAEVEERYKLFLGVILSDRIAFVRYDSKIQDWLMRGPYDLNRETVLRLVEAMRGLRRKKLAVDELLRDFGPESQVTKNAVKVFYCKVTESDSSKVEALFNDWKRLFSQVCAYSPDKLKGLESEYEISGHIDYDALLFSIHTYSALIMKLLGAEVAYLYGAGKWLKSYVAELEDAHMKGLDALLRALEDLENGGIFRELLNITNFIEGDYFSWYLEELDEELALVIAEIANKLADYEPATPVLEPEYTRDLLKRLYQNLVPKKIRHGLGEYYTPDWLAELVLNEVGLTNEDFEKLAQEGNDSLSPINLRILDPACGSGTFLIIAVKRLREYAEEHYLRDVLADYILRNVVGFDLNPLAVLAARTNFLLAVADLLPYVKGSIEIPIYLADSLLVEAKTTLIGTLYVIRTYVGEFQISKSIIDKGLLGRLLDSIDRYVRLRYRIVDFKQMVENELDLDESELKIIGDMYKTFLKLEEEGKNHVWTSIIKNAFAPLTIIGSTGRFEYVVGNPPWINWENLPESYRNDTKKLWSYYGLLKKTKGGGMGKVKRDIAMLFVTRCLDRYVKDKGKLSFLIPFTTYKTRAGAGFRNYLANKCEVLKIHDLVELFPFEGAINRTSLIIISKGKTTFPINCIMWQHPRRGAIGQESELHEVYMATRQFDMMLEPIYRGKPETPWILVSDRSKQAVRQVIGRCSYKAHAGLYPGINGIFWMDIVSDEGSNLLVRNLSSVGKKKVEEVTALVERELVYPLVRGRDLQKWTSKVSNYIIVPHEGNTGKPFSEKIMKIDYSRAYQYFTNFRDTLLKRPIHKLWGKKNPFYSVYNIGSYTFLPWKVGWKYISGRISGKGDFKVSVLPPISNMFLADSPLIPGGGTVMFVSCESEDEAYYLSSILNSSPVRLVINSYAMEIHMSTYVIEPISIEKFDPENPLHQELAKLSKKAHELAEKDDEQHDSTAYDELIQVENEIDRIISKLYGITDEGLTEVKRALRILGGEDVREEEVYEEEPEEIKVDFLDAVVRPNLVGSFEVAVSNPLKEEVTIELELPDNPVKLETNKEEDKIRVAVSPLETGEYAVPYKIITSERIAKGNFTLYVKEEDKRRIREELSSKLDKLLRE